MQFQDVTYVGPAFDDAELLDELPAELAAFLLEENGFIAVRGSFHVRGACCKSTTRESTECLLGNIKLSQSAGAIVEEHIECRSGRTGYADIGPVADE